MSGAESPIPSRPRHRYPPPPHPVAPTARPARSPAQPSIRVRKKRINAPARSTSSARSASVRQVRQSRVSAMLLNDLSTYQLGVDQIERISSDVPQSSTTKNARELPSGRLIGARGVREPLKLHLTSLEVSG